MSKELVSRDILDDIWDLYEKYHPYLATRVWEFGYALKEIIITSPTVEERPQGKWILHGMIYYCSNCGHDCGESGDNFCGNCGAKMEES